MKSPLTVTGSHPRQDDFLPRQRSLLLPVTDCVVPYSPTQMARRRGNVILGSGCALHRGIHLHAVRLVGDII